MNVLITGGSGLLGEEVSHKVAIRVQVGIDVVRE